jgi:hypothetical protein
MGADLFSLLFTSYKRGANVVNKFKSQKCIGKNCLNLDLWDLHDAINSTRTALPLIQGAQLTHPECATLFDLSPTSRKEGKKPTILSMHFQYPCYKEGYF